MLETSHCELRQGDWLTGIDRLAIMTGESNSRSHNTAHGAAVVTQCCDLARNTCDVVHLAPIEKLQGADQRDALSGRTSRYAHIAGDFFADLSIVVSVSRSLADTVTVARRMTVVERTTFAERVMRRFGRFAYPDELHPVLEPLKRKVRSKAQKDGSIADALARVATLRLECEPDWDTAEGLTLTLLVVVEADYLPSVPMEYIHAAGDTSPPPDLAAAADAILRAAPHDLVTIEHWQVFGRALAALLEHGREKAAPGLVANVEVEVMRTDELTYERFRRSVDLDLDDLSPTLRVV